MSRSRATLWSRIILNQLHHISGTGLRPARPTMNPSCPAITRHFSASPDAAEVQRQIQNLLFQIEKDRQREREERKRKGLDTADIDAEEDEDSIGVGPLIEKLEKRKAKEDADSNLYEEWSESDSDDDDERYSPEAVQKKIDVFEKKFKRHEQLLKSFTDAETIEDAHKLMNCIDKFEEKHFKLRPEYRVIGELMNRLKVAEGKEKFLLQQKLNRAMRMIEWREAYDPNDPANYGVIIREQIGTSAEVGQGDFEDEKTMIEGGEDDDDLDFDDLKEKDDILLEKLSAIDKKLEQKLAELDHTFGRKGRLLEEEIRDLAEERNSLTEKKRTPLYRKGFDVKLIDVNRTCKVTKGGQVVNYSAILACGNYQGVIGYAKAKGPAVPIALQKAYEKCFQNLHSVERYEEHTIAHAVQTSYKKTKVYLWPASTTTGMKAGRTVQTILNLAGFQNVKSKVVGSRNPHNTVKALFKALNEIKTPKDVQTEFGRTVVESYQV
ncbi:OLC1v1025650C1 [Oldenlandia corymbosa var. corymbosa]|uniref:OLC1v1025650C1 n=1 Tax=Oldenlandia corymbosa var. corymbosa TaxID=529605 RepID=A0AAV1C6Q7_OLDCO|nr:OLC1v1025650C1 [Oldenlandia corymbosa var. corymbosa]